MREQTKHGMSIYGTQPLEDWAVHMDQQQKLRREQRFVRAPYSGALNAPAIQDYRLPAADDIVVISGLNRRPELNGRVGRVAATGYDDQNRVLIRLDACAESDTVARPRHMRVSVTRLKLLRPDASSDMDVAKLYSSASSRARLRASSTGSLHRPQSAGCQPAPCAPSEAGSSLPSTRAPSDAGSSRSFGNGAPLEATGAGLNGPISRSSRRCASATGSRRSIANCGELTQMSPGEDLKSLGLATGIRPLTAGSAGQRSATSNPKGLASRQSDRPKHSLQNSKDVPHGSAVHPGGQALKLVHSASFSDKASSHTAESPLAVEFTRAGMAQDGVLTSQQKTRPQSASLLAPAQSAGASRMNFSAKSSVKSNSSLRS